MSAESGLFADEAERRLIDGILNELIPANAAAGVPAAGDLGIGSYLATLAQQDVSIATELKQGIAQTSSKAAAHPDTFETWSALQRTEFVQLLEQLNPAFFQSLLRYTYMGYYSRSDIRPLFGLSAKPTQPDGYEVPLESPFEMASLTRAVKQRGRCYRK